MPVWCRECSEIVFLYPFFSSFVIICGVIQAGALKTYSDCLGSRDFPEAAQVRSSDFNKLPQRASRVCRCLLLAYVRAVGTIGFANLRTTANPTT